MFSIKSNLFHTESHWWPKGGWCLLSFSLFLCLSLSFSLFLSLSLSFSLLLWLSTWEQQSEKSQRTEAASISQPQKTWTVECNCRRIFANIWFSQVWKHSSYTYAIPWCFTIWAWLRHEFLETAIPWWSTSKFWPRHELGMSLSFDCN